MNASIRRGAWWVASLCVVAAASPARLWSDAPISPSVIPPGQDEVVTRLLTPDSAWPPGIQLQDAGVQQQQITARYHGDGCDLTLQLQHPSSAPPASARTQQFAISWTAQACDGARAAAIAAVLQAQVQRHERDFRWVDAEAALPQSATSAAAAASERPADRVARILDQGAEALRAGERVQATRLLGEAATAVAQLTAAEQPMGWAGVAALARALGDPAADDHANAALRAAGQAGRGPETAVARVRGLLAAGQFEEALRAVDAVAGQATWRAEACKLSAHPAEDLALAGEPQRGLTVLRRWQLADPDCVEVALGASRLARRAGLGASVVGHLEEAVRRHPEDVPLTIHLAHLYKELKRHKEALALVNRIDFKGVTLDKALVLDITRIYLDTLDSEDSLTPQRQRADAHPDDVVAAFIVGTILHHTGQWQASNAYLARSQQAFALEPRQFIYTAMNHFRLGHQAEGERLIEEALRLGSRDPDIYYCRAVIWSNKDPRKAAADLQTYLKMTEGSHETYAPKEAKVAQMLADLRTCQDAKDVAECLQTEATLHGAKKKLPWLAGALALLALVLWRWRRRRVAAAVVVALTVASAPAAEAWAATPATWSGFFGSAAPTWTDGWQLTQFDVESDRVVVRLAHQQHGPLALLLLPRESQTAPWARTTSYDIVPATAGPLSEPARRQLQVVVQAVSRADHGQQTLAGPQTPSTRPGDVRPTLATPTSWAAQWTWLDGLGRVQLLLGLLMLLASAFFLSRWPARPSPPCARYQSMSSAGSDSVSPAA